MLVGEATYAQKILMEKSDFLEKSDFFNPQNVKTLLRIYLSLGTRKL
jgi:hypothetical protein